MLYFGSDLWTDSVQVTVGSLHPSLWLHVRLTLKCSSTSVSAFPLPALSMQPCSGSWSESFISDSGKTTTENCNGSFISNIADPFLQYSLFLSWFPNEKLIWTSCKIYPCTTDIFVLQYQNKQKLCHKNTYNNNNWRHVQRRSLECGNADFYGGIIPFTNTKRAVL